MATTHNFKVNQGEDFAFRFALGEQDADGNPVLDEEGNAVKKDLSLEGITAIRMQVRKEAKSSTAILDLSITSGNITIDEVNNMIEIVVDAADMTTAAGVKAGDAVYDIEIARGASVKKMFSGKFKIIAEVTR